jgi:hypothetical protein
MLELAPLLIEVLEGLGEYELAAQYRQSADELSAAVSSPGGPVAY